MDTVSSAAEADLAILCRSCGLCCDGSLFGRVDLEPEEVEPARRHRLRLVRGDHAFEQPCAAFDTSGPAADRRCFIYDERPRSCHRFTCRLYERYRTEGGPVESRIAVVRRVRQLVACLEASGLTAADLEVARSSRQQADPRIATAMAAYLELMRSLEDDFSRARRSSP